MKRTIDVYTNILRRHLLTNDDRKFLDIANPYNEYILNPLAENYVPEFRLSDFDKRNMDPKVLQAFPLSTNSWLKPLPKFIKMLLGTAEFEKAILIHFSLACWHRSDNDCSRCNNTMRIYPDEIADLDGLISLATTELRRSRDEIENDVNLDLIELDEIIVEELLELNESNNLGNLFN